MERETRVTFADDDKLCTVYELEEEDRKGQWEEFVRDRERFQRRIARTGKILEPVLSFEIRKRIYQNVVLKENIDHV